MHGSSSTRGRGNPWLPLWLLLAAAAVPLLGFGGWKYRRACSRAYHLSRMEQSLFLGNDAEVAGHLYAVYALDPEALAAALRRATGWSRAQRRRAAEILMEHPDFMRARSTYIPYDTMSRVFGGLYLQEPAVHPRVGADVVLALDPDNLEALRCKAEERYRRKDYRGCVYCLERIDAVSRRVGNTPSDRDYMLWGAALAELDRYGEAAEKFGFAARMRPRAFIALAARERALARQGRYAEAVRVCTEIVRRAQSRMPDVVPEVLLERGQMLGLLGRDELALRDLAAATEIARRQGLMRPGALLELRLGKVRALINMREPAAALRELADIVRKHPANIELLALRSYALADLGRYREAERCLREAMLDNPMSPYLYNHLAWIKATAADPSFRDPEEALRLARKALALDRGRSPAILDTLAEAYYVNRMFDRAVEHESLALARGGESYRRSLERFRAARDRAARGERVELTPSPLIDHEKFPPPAPGQVLELASLRPPPRVGLQEYRSVLGRRMRFSRRVSADDAARYLAVFWAGYPVPAVDDPRQDFRCISMALLQLRWSPRSAANAGDRRFLLALATAFTEGGEQRLPGLSSAGTLAKRDLSPELAEAVFAFRIVRLVRKDLTPAQAGEVLRALAGGKLRFSQLYDLRWYDKTRPPSRGRLRGDLLERAWERISARVRLAAEGKPLPALRLAGRPPPQRPSPGGLAPPPED